MNQPNNKLGGFASFTNGFSGRGKLLLLILGLAVSANFSRASVWSWSGGGGANAYWNNSANWGFAGTPGNGDTVIFPAGQPNLLNTNNIAGLILNEIRFAGPTGGYDIRGNPFALTNDVQATNSAGINTIENAITLATAANVTFNVGTGVGLVLDGNLSGGAVGVTKTGLGTLTYQGPNSSTYTGTTTVKAGTLLLNVGGVNAISGPLIIGDGTGSGSPAVQNLQGLELEDLPSVTINLNGQLNLNGYSEPYFSPNLTLNGGTLTTGAGTLTLLPNATITLGAGYTDFIEGQLNTGSGTLTVQGTGYVYFDAATAGAANIVQSGSASTLWTGANTYSGNYTANGNGYVYLFNSRALGNVTNQMTLNDQTYIYINGNVNVTNQSLTVASTAANTIISYASSTNSWTSSNFIFNATCVVDVESGCGLNLIGTITGAGGLTKVAPGFLTLSGTGENSYTGPTLVNAGLLQLNHDAGHSIGSSSSITIGTGTGAANSVVVRYIDGLNGNQIWIGIPSIINSDGWLDLNGESDDIGALTITGGQVTTGTGQAQVDGDIHVQSSAQQATISGNLELLFGRRTISVDAGAAFYNLVVNAVILDDGSGVNISNGAGRPNFVRLISSNAFTGPLTISGLTVSAENPFALGTTAGGTLVTNGGELFLYSTSATNETLTLADGSTFTAQNNCAWHGPVVLGGDVTLKNFASGLFDINGPISGAGNIDSTGSSGQNQFSGSTANTFTGTTIVGSGQLLLAKNSGVAVPSNLVVSNGATATLAGYSQLASSADVFVNGGGLFDCSTYFTFVNTLRGTGNVNFSTSGWINVGSLGGSSEFDGKFTGTGYAPGYTVGKQGSGTFVLGGNSSYINGITHVLGGSMVINGSQLGIPVTVDSGATLSGSGTVGTILANGAVAPGNGGPGILNCSNVVFSASGKMVAELNGPTLGTGYDQLNSLLLIGPPTLGNATLQVVPTFTSAVTVGQQFTILNNSSAASFSGTFNGLPEGSAFTAGAYKFTISYAGGTGNDAVLTLVSVPGAVASAGVTAGDGSHGIDPNGCNNLTLAITNSAAQAMSGVTATLSTTTEGVVITQPYANYPNISAGGIGTNTTPFQISTLPSFVCSTPINLQLTVDSSLGAFTMNYVLNTGEPAAAAARHDTNAVMSIPDVGSIDSTNIVSGFAALPLAKVAVSLYITHSFDADLTNISLIAPDGTQVLLSSANGGGGANYGTGLSPDSARTTFDDSAATPITSGTAPFAGTFRPQAPLAAFAGNPSPNGNWHLHIADGYGGSLGTLRGWSLFLYGTACNTGSGACDYCLTSISGAITGTDSTQIDRISRTGLPGSCGAPKAWPGPIGDALTRHCDIYAFTNTSLDDACVTVVLTSSGDLQAGLYLNSFNPSNLATNYLMDSGNSTAGSTSNPQSCSASIPPGATFYVTVNEVTPNTGGPYTLQLSGLPCPPPTLHIQPITPGKARLYWDSSAGGYVLESITNLNATAWGSVTNEPIVNAGNYTVTNSTLVPATNHFYRLRKP